MKLKALNKYWITLLPGLFLRTNPIYGIER